MQPLISTVAQTNKERCERSIKHASIKIRSELGSYAVLILDDYCDGANTYGDRVLRFAQHRVSSCLLVVFVLEFIRCFGRRLIPRLRRDDRLAEITVEDKKRIINRIEAERREHALQDFLASNSI